jgi:hypothetical protein
MTMGFICGTPMLPKNDKTTLLALLLVKLPYI